MKIKAKIAKSIAEKAIGLMGKKNSPPMLFKTRFGIHTFFLSKPIDVLVLNSEGIVVVVKSYLKPFRFFFYNPKYNLVLELKKGFTLSQNIKVGDKIKIIS